MRNRRLRVAAALIVIHSLAPTGLGSANRPGAACKTVDRVIAVKIKMRSSDLVSTQVSKTKILEIRAGSAGGKPATRDAGGGTTSTTTTVAPVAKQFVTEVSSDTRFSRMCHSYKLPPTPCRREILLGRGLPQPRAHRHVTTSSFCRRMVPVCDSSTTATTALYVEYRPDIVIKLARLRSLWIIHHGNCKRKWSCLV